MNSFYYAFQAQYLVERCKDLKKIKSAKIFGIMALLLLKICPHALNTLFCRERILVDVRIVNLALGHMI